MAAAASRMTVTAIVGAGLMGRWHAVAAQRAGMRIACVADPDFARARTLAQHLSATPHASLEAALAHSRPDVIQICAPLAAHERLVVTALDAGCHVLVEKPVAPDLESTDRLLERAETAGRFLCPVHQYLFQRGTIKLTRRLPDLGRIVSVDYVACSAGAEGQADDARAALVREILPHPLSVLERLRPGSLAAAEWTARETAPGELRVMGALSGVTTGILVSTRGRPTCSTLRVVAERGSAKLDFFHGFAAFESGGVSRRRKALRPFSVSVATGVTAAANLGRRALRREWAYPGLNELVARFARAVSAGGPAPIPPQETRAVAAALEAIVASCRR